MLGGSCGRRRNRCACNRRRQSRGGGVHRVVGVVHHCHCRYQPRWWQAKRPFDDAILHKHDGPAGAPTVALASVRCRERGGRRASEHPRTRSGPWGHGARREERARKTGAAAERNRGQGGREGLRNSVASGRPSTRGRPVGSHRAFMHRLLMSVRGASVRRRSLPGPPAISVRLRCRRLRRKLVLVRTCHGGGRGGGRQVGGLGLKHGGR